jgi:hypothetical protein
MAERRKPRKRNGKTPPEKPRKEPQRLSLLDLPPAAEALNGLVDQPTHPALGRPEPKRTLLPTAVEPIADASLESLAQLAHRAAGVPTDRPSTNRMLAAYAPDVARGSAPPPPDPSEYAARTLPELVAHVAPAPLPTLPSPPPDFGRPSSLPPPADFGRPSSLPPPVQMPSEPPPRARVARAASGGSPWLRTLGVIVLSATVGAVVSSAIWGVKTELSAAVAQRATHAGVAAPGVVPAEHCPPSTSVAETKPTIAAAIAAEPAPLVAETRAAEAPRISIEALPLQQSRRRDVVPERVSLDPSPSTQGSSHEAETRPASQRASRHSEAPPRSRSQSKRAPSPPPPRTLPAQPSRAAVSQAVGRAASAAASCDGGPHDGKVTVTFAPSGSVQSVSLAKGFGDAAVNGCVLRAFGRARVPAFSGDPVQVRKSLAW